MRLIAIGDVHGQAQALQELLLQLGPQPDDQFVFLGDLIDRGPASREVVQQVLRLSEQYRVECILGNHEEMALLASTGRSEFNQWLKFGARETLRSYGITAPYTAMEPLRLNQFPPEHVRLFGNMHDYWETDHHIFLHASYLPYLPMDQQPIKHLRWTRFDRHLQPHRSGKTVVCGHSADRTVRNRGHAICIDTGCGVYSTGMLTALDVLSGQSWAQPAPLSQ